MQFLSSTRFLPCFLILYFFFFFNDTATTEIYTLSLTTLFRSDPWHLHGRGCHLRGIHRGSAPAAEGGAARLLPGRASRPWRADRPALQLDLRREPWARGPRHRSRRWVAGGAQRLDALRRPARGRAATRPRAVGGRRGARVVAVGPAGDRWRGGDRKS